jgi:hypothetical protein
MMIRISFCLFFCCTLPFIPFAQIGQKKISNQISGIWQNQTAGIQMMLLLDVDGKGEFDGESIQYIIENNKLILTSNQSHLKTIYTFRLESNTLTLSDGDLDAPVVFTRFSSGKDQALPSPTESKIPSDVVNLPNTNPSKEASAISSAIYGTWSGNGESIEFKNNMQCIYLGQTYAYDLTATHCTLKTTQGNIIMAYTIQGDQLTLTINGQKITYQKGSSGVLNNTTNNTNRRVAMELVGKWCYVNVNSTASGGSSSNQCITLNGNGTYEYYGETFRSVNTNAYAGGTASQSGDRGTWSYDGQKIYYVSATGVGSGSFTLEKRNHPKNNDPMIVLDGVTYVTFYQKDSWR